MTIKSNELWEIVWVGSKGKGKGKQRDRERQWERERKGERKRQKNMWLFAIVDCLL